MSIEVYVIWAVLNIPFYFIFKNVFRKRIGDKRKRSLLIWACMLAAAPVFYVLLVIGFFAAMAYYPDRDFDREGWNTNKDTRYEYSESLIESRMLIGKTKTEVRRLLGADEGRDNDSSWCYELGFKPGFGNIDPDYMCIKFLNDKVVSVEQHEG
ncbi:hypothetical protein BC343_11090 [Mucilaginibacter pedocola]|uniref:Outer membrane protein assembly factor BamE n=1 Tax=Mucilaginibacter pedocola TaxID=1792845 RepID=A0A1S9PBL4_9SPHI|nr:hypothetical protein BC343_11090 [Mucilaginibacter pedocola]